MSLRPAYRPDIEGLRGVAILLVVLFHAGVGLFAGGFVGVDVFFVLSGFFITAMLAQELADTGTVNVTEFLGKRALRLLPALLVVLAFTLVTTMWLYAPIDRPQVASNARAVALYAGNVEFARNTVDYFGSQDNPLLHTWSLAVEEQFYLVWPMLFLLVGAIYGAKLAADPEEQDDATRKRLLVGIVVAGALSFGFSIWLTNVSQPWAFFGMGTRIWEFALGGALAMTMNSYPTEGAAVPFARLLQWLGLLAIGLGVVFYDQSTAYPGVAAMLPALGAVALLVGGHRAPDSHVSRGLSAAWLQWLGRMSYAWYLWHWPLIGIGTVLNEHIGVAGKLAWSLLALVLAYFTNRWIEQPARKSEGAFARIPNHWVAPAALVASVGAAVGAHATLVAARAQSSKSPQKIFAAARGDRMQHNCWASTVDQPTGRCEFGDRTASTTYALLGDSHAEHWLGALDRAGREHGFKVVAMVKGGCPVAEMPQMMRRKKYYHECTRYREAMVQRIIAMKPDAVILSSWDHYMPPSGKGSAWQVTPEHWRNGLRRTYERLAAADLKIVAIRGTPRTWFDVPTCLSRRAAGLLAAKRCVYDRARSMMPLAIAAQNDAARGLPVRFIDMNDQICATQRCQVTRGRVVIFTDDNHLTATFSKSVAPVMAQRLASALAD
jgi:peptidoglycan/LPS O-acetylase OafA/YrhL